MAIQDKRISKVRTWLFEIINSLQNDTNYQINANMLSNKVDDYSLDKIPTQSVVEPYITGGGLYRDVYAFRTRKSYGVDTITNLQNMGFFEDLEKAIKTNNEEGNLPDDVLSVVCLTPFTMQMNDDGKTTIFDTQLQIEYEEE